MGEAQPTEHLYTDLFPISLRLVNWNLVDAIDRPLYVSIEPERLGICRTVVDGDLKTALS
jgi:hypothetical protein